MAGRQRTFEESGVLDAAMQTFWKHGYEAASYSHLTKAMRLTRPSIYGAFGNKEELFLRTIDRYVETWAEPTLAKLYAEKTLPAALAAFYRAVIENVTAMSPSCGCLIATVLTSSAGTSPKFRARLKRIVSASDQALENRLRIAQQQAELPPALDLRSLVNTLNNVRYGFALRARSGATRDELLAGMPGILELILGPLARHLPTAVN